MHISTPAGLPILTVDGASDLLGKYLIGRPVDAAGNLGSGSPELYMFRFGRMIQGESNLCMIGPDAGLRCAGYNDHLLLGVPSSVLDGTTIHHEFIRNPGLASVQQASMGTSMSCALIAGGDVNCWGSGVGTHIPQSVNLGGSDALEIAAADSRACARLDNGTVTCWSWSLVPSLVANISTATQISVYANHACAVLADKTVSCWGNNAKGQLGDGSTVGRPAAAAVPGIVNARFVRAMPDRTCAVLETNQIWCWGNIGSSVVGNGLLPDQLVPVQVSTFSSGTVADMAGRLSDTCAVVDGIPSCQNGGTEDMSVLSTITDAASISASTGSLEGYCVTTSAGNSTCWNSFFNRQLDVSSPRQVVDVDDAVQISLSDSHACARLKDGLVKCWGDNSSGQVGNGSSGGSVLRAITVGNLSGSVGVSAGGQHTCAVTVQGKVKCWGDNSSDELGSSVGGSTGVATEVPGITTAKVVAAGEFHTCALLTDGTVTCWGSNGYGQLGNGTFASSAIPVQVTGISTAVDLVAHGSSTFVILADRTVRSWGDNGQGQLGDGSNGNVRSSAVTVGQLSSVLSLSNSGTVDPSQSICAVVSGGDVYCWGKYRGADQVDVVLSVPTKIADFANVTSVASNNSGNICASLIDGRVKCQGVDSVYGYFGIRNLQGTGPSYYYPPVQIPGIGTVKSVTLAAGFGCVLQDSGRVVCFGSDTFGRTGGALDSEGEHALFSMGVEITP